MFLYNEDFEESLLDLLKAAAEDISQVRLFPLANQLENIVKESADPLLFLSGMGPAIEGKQLASKDDLDKIAFTHLL